MRELPDLTHEPHTARRPASACPDCALLRLNLLASATPPNVEPCLFRCVAVEARSPLPPRWFKELRFGVVRRGIVVRQRFDGQGCATAVDAVGTGGLVPLASSVVRSGDPVVTGYAATDAMLCVCTVEAADAMMATDARVAREVLELHRQAMERMERLGDARGRPNVLARVAATLAALVDCLSPLRATEVIPSELQHADLAALVAARQETVCRAVKTLERRGVIARDADGTRIVDRAALDAS
jgi:hypothetical protein